VEWAHFPAPKGEGVLAGGAIRLGARLGNNVKQVLQSLKTGETHVLEVPCPQVRPGCLLIRTERSLISAGTERMLVNFGRAGLWEKARQQPEKVRAVVDKARADGVRATLLAVKQKLDEPLPLGYCNVGVVLEVGEGVSGFEVGDRVASNGNHAEIVCVPKNLCAKVPADVTADQAAFAVLGAVALQGIRLAQPTLGEFFVVTGLGLVGLLATQLLRLHGCHVLGLDFDETRLSLARQWGAETLRLTEGEDPVAAAVHFSRGRGVDGVLVTASTKSDEPVHQAARMCRKRGRIVVVGVVGMKLTRADFYDKELSFQVSCSYGPGRHDREYEARGKDYPFGLVRWTEQRNFEAVLDMLADDRLCVQPLVSHRFPLPQAHAAYETIVNDASSLGVLLEYASEPPGCDPPVRRQTIRLLASANSSDARNHGRHGASPIRVSFLGAGNFARRILIPAFKQQKTRLVSVASEGGLSAAHVAKMHGFERATTDVRGVLHDSETDVVVIATRHDSHAGLAAEALRAGKHVFVEKPLATGDAALSELSDAYEETRSLPFPPVLTAGFNRRCSPHILKMAALLRTVPGPRTMVYTVNAGELPEDHWNHEPAIGGGRMIGEGCHFIDVLRYLCDAPVCQVQAMMIGARHGTSPRDDKMTLQLSFADGSIGTIHYWANGHRAFPKERLEVFAAGRVLQLDNFRGLRGYGWPGFRKMILWRQDKGHEANVVRFLAALKDGGGDPIPWPELREVTQVSFDAVRAAKSGDTIRYAVTRSVRDDLLPSQTEVPLPRSA
jgi:predicted dehydrogenase/threonine dehydrogenase-like Zn-dependent dehydrogenase